MPSEEGLSRAQPSKLGGCWAGHERQPRDGPRCVPKCAGCPPRLAPPPPLAGRAAGADGLHHTGVQDAGPGAIWKFGGHCPGSVQLSKGHGGCRCCTGTTTAGADSPSSEALSPLCPWPSPTASLFCLLLPLPPPHTSPISRSSAFHLPPCVLSPPLSAVSLPPAFLVASTTRPHLHLLPGPVFPESSCRDTPPTSLSCLLAPELGVEEQVASGPLFPSRAWSGVLSGRSQSLSCPREQCKMRGQQWNLGEPTQSPRESGAES